MPIDKEKYKEFYEEGWGAIIRKERENRCEICGVDNGELMSRTKDAEKYSVIITTHHIDGNPSNNCRENLILLCQKHHLRANRRLYDKNQIKLGAD